MGIVTKWSEVNRRRQESNSRNVKRKPAREMLLNLQLINSQKFQINTVLMVFELDILMPCRCNPELAFIGIIL